MALAEQLEALEGRTIVEASLAQASLAPGDSSLALKLSDGSTLSVAVQPPHPGVTDCHHLSVRHQRDYSTKG
jgi:hypothetical protein